MASADLSKVRPRPHTSSLSGWSGCRFLLTLATAWSSGFPCLVQEHFELEAQPALVYARASRVDNQARRALAHRGERAANHGDEFVEVVAEIGGVPGKRRRVAGE